MNEHRPDGRSGLDRFLSLFAEVHPGEGLTSILLVLNVFLLLTSYYIIKPVREALILSLEGGAELKSYLAAAMAVLLILIVPAYGRLAERFPRARLITVVTLFFISNLIVFYLLSFSFHGTRWLGALFFVWVGIFNLMVIAQFWSFANDIYSPDQGKRLFAIVGFGASSGAVAGSWLAGRMVERLGLFQMLLAAALVLAICIVITLVVNRRETSRIAEVSAAQRSAAPVAPETMQAGNGFALVVRNRYLLLIGVLLRLLNLVNTTGEYILGTIVKDWAATNAAGGDIGQAIGGFYADFFTWVNLAGMLIQLFLVSRIVKYLGVRIGLLILPIIALATYVSVAFIPVLSILRIFKTAENATDYSLHNTLRNMLFLPTSRAEKYKAKQALDTFFVRAGDVVSALLIFAGTSLLGLGIAGFAAMNVVFAIVWIALAARIGRRFDVQVAELDQRA